MPFAFHGSSTGRGPEVTNRCRRHDGISSVTMSSHRHVTAGGRRHLRPSSFLFNDAKDGCGAHHVWHHRCISQGKNGLARKTRRNRKRTNKCMRDIARGQTADPGSRIQHYLVEFGARVETGALYRWGIGPLVCNGNSVIPTMFRNQAAMRERSFYPQCVF